jgi:hypothetical protein
VLVHHDLDNFLEPLATHLGPRRIVRASATKRGGGASTLTIGPVVPSGEPEGEWCSATVAAAGLNSDLAKRAVGRDVARQARPLPWGPVELEIAMRVGAERDPVKAWKPIIDSLVAILGRAPGKSEFDIEDGRIVRLAIHRHVDVSLQHAVEARLWWRMSGSRIVEGPSLSYDVLHTRPTGGDPGAASRSAAPARAPASRFETITTIERLQEVQLAREGFVLITDNANPTRLHRAGCTAIREENFLLKVVANGMRNGQYLHTRDLAAARDRWRRRTEHGCVSQL